MKLNTLVLALATTLAFTACQPGDKPAETATAEATAAETASEATAPAADATVLHPDAADLANDTQGSTGVAECDDYLNKMLACVNDKIPESQRVVMQQGIEQAKAGWASIADKTTLGAQCKAAMDQARTAYTAMGCSF